MFEQPDAASLGSAVEAVSVCYRRESHAPTSRTSPFIRVNNPTFNLLKPSSTAQSGYHNSLRDCMDPICRFSS